MKPNKKESLMNHVIHFLKSLIKKNQDEICHATSNSFQGSSVQIEDVLREKILDDTSEIDLGHYLGKIWQKSVSNQLLNAEAFMLMFLWQI